MAVKRLPIGNPASGSRARQLRRAPIGAMVADRRRGIGNPMTRRRGIGNPMMAGNADSMPYAVINNKNTLSIGIFLINNLNQ